METSQPPPLIAPAKRSISIWPFILLTPVVLILLLAVGILSMLTVSGETRAMRNAVVRNCAVPCQKRIDLSFGFFTFGIAHLASDFIKMPDEARTAIQSVKNVEVSIYHLSRADNLDPAAILSNADAAMQKRGWTRIVGVAQRRELIAVYAPEKKLSEHNLQVATLVLDNRDLVCVSARANPELLVELAVDKIHSREFAHGEKEFRFGNWTRVLAKTGK